MPVPELDLFAPFKLTGRLAVVTGAASGIGRETAIFFARAGAEVVVSDTNAIGLAECASVIAASGGVVHQVVTDVCSLASIDELAAEAERKGPISIWANVAGIGGLTPIMDVDADGFNKIRSINMDGVYWCCAAAAKCMVPRGRGSIINVSSNAADQPIAALSAYAMTKAAVNMLTRSLAVELGPQGIRVNAVAPGFVQTAMTVADKLTKAERKELLARNAARSPIDAVGEPSDIAYAMLYLASDAAKFVTGQILRVNGGVAMP